MNKGFSRAMLCGFLLLFGGHAMAADTVPTDAQMPGTQPDELSKAPDSGRCGNCHGGYDASAEPYHTWRGSMMSHAGRDPIFWATLAIAEQDFDGSGDICLRCHMPGTWLDGRSVPTDGSGATRQGDGEWGVQCDLCHRLVNPDGTEHPGTQTPPFVASTDGEGHYGSGQYVLSDGNDKFGPYADAEARHGSLKSSFHRSPDLCGTCHDVSNPVVGNLAHNNGAQDTADPVIDDDTLGGPVDGKAAFDNPPYKYGIVERTYSEHIASGFDTLLVDNLNTLPAELRDGAILRAWQAATQNGSHSANYEDGDPRYFTCQSCHMVPENLDPITLEATQGCNKNPPLRTDMPVHDLTGGNYWMPTAIQYMDDAGTLLLGGGIDSEERTMMNDGILRAQGNLNVSASLTVDEGNDTLRVVNLTGHKLISGYPEGRRMWLNITWYDTNGALIREDGAYGDIQLQYDANGDGQVNSSDTVRSLLSLGDSNGKVYEAHGAITQEWASQLVALNSAYGSVPVEFDRVTGQVTATIGDVASQAAGTYHETFHFVLNNKVVKDNRIPPWGMSYDEARVRNSLPVPADQYGNPGTGGTYNYYDVFQLTPPTDAVYAEIDLLYQPTSWEYIQFLTLANNGSNSFLADEGRNLQEAWMATGMAEPHVMASTTWGTAPGGGNAAPVAYNDAYSTDQDTPLSVPAPGVLGNDTDADGDALTVADPRTSAATTQDGTVTLNSDGSFSYTPASDFAGDDTFTYTATDGTDTSNTATVTITVNAAGGNSAPVANDDAYTTDQDVPLTDAAPGVLGNDTDADGDALTVADPRTDAATDQGGSVTLNSDGSFSYTPLAGFTGDDSFSYSATDGTDTSNAATVTVSVAGAVECSTFTDKQSCNAEATCRWDNRNKMCIAK
ncbi:MAG: Ig-like domain-containing protein [Gammaproteobacteria bacterium]